MTHALRLRVGAHETVARRLDETAFHPRRDMHSAQTFVNPLLVVHGTASPVRPRQGLPEAATACPPSRDLRVEEAVARHLHAPEGGAAHHPL